MRIPFISFAAVQTIPLLAASFSQPAIAQYQPQLSQNCSAAIQTAHSSLKENRDISTQVWYRQMTNDENYPVGRPNSLNFGVGGSSASSVMASPQFLTNIAANIIDGCPTISTVVYIQERSDYARTFGLMNGGDTKEFECSFMDRSRSFTDPLPWGVVRCL